MSAFLYVPIFLAEKLLGQNCLATHHHLESLSLQGKASFKARHVTLSEPTLHIVYLQLSDVISIPQLRTSLWPYNAMRGGNQLSNLKKIAGSVNLPGRDCFTLVKRPQIFLIQKEMTFYDDPKYTLLPDTSTIGKIHQPSGASTM